MTPALRTGLFGTRSIHLIRQTEVAECGLACLAMIANFYGLDIDLGTLRRQFQPSLRGISAKSIMAMSDALGLRARAVKLPKEKISSLVLPAILHWDFNHFVVLGQLRNGKALIHNPEGLSQWLTLEEMATHFTGVALEVVPTNDFEPHSRRTRLRISQLWRKVTGLKRATLQVIVLSLFMQGFVVASPYYMQIAIDGVIPSLDTSLLAVLALGFALFSVLNAVALLLRSFVLLSIGTTLGFGISSNIALRMLKLPISWFEKRHVGDVLSRFQAVSPIQEFLTQGAVSALLDGILAAITLFIMFFYSFELAMITIFAFTLFIVLRVLTFTPQRMAQEAAIVAAGKEQSTMIESLRGIVTIRLFNRETFRHSHWLNRLGQATNASVAVSRLNNWQKAGEEAIFGLENVVSIWLGIRAVINGGFSIGMVFAYLAYKTQFLSRGRSFIDQLVAFRMLSLYLERLSDIALSDKDPSFELGSVETAPLSGRIELRDVSFRYSSTDPLILNNVNLVVEPGAHVAITGPSGGGKSTLIRILLGLVEPESGEVLVDGMPLSKIGLKRFHDQISGILQDDHLFSGSIKDNIALFDDDPDMNFIVSAATAASINRDIIAMPMGYETLVGDMGSALSGGQKQRILLARALYRRPRMLIVDEATSHLDSVHERAVNDSISQLGITRIVVAHRSETIAAADRVYSLEGKTLRAINTEVSISSKR